MKNTLSCGVTRFCPETGACRGFVEQHKCLTKALSDPATFYVLLTAFSVKSSTGSTRTL